MRLTVRKVVIIWKEVSVFVVSSQLTFSNPPTVTSCRALVSTAAAPEQDLAEITAETMKNIYDGCVIFPC